MEERSRYSRQARWTSAKDGEPFKLISSCRIGCCPIELFVKFRNSLRNAILLLSRVAASGPALQSRPDFLEKITKNFLLQLLHPPLWYLNRKCLKSSPWKARRPWVKNSRSNSPAVKRTFVQSWTNYSFLSDPKSITNHSKITNQFKKYFYPERTVTNHFNYSMFNIWLTPFCPNFSCVLFRFQKMNTVFFRQMWL